MIGDGEAHSRYAIFWDIYFGLVAGAIAIATLLLPGVTSVHRWTAFGAVAAMVLLHLTIGRRLVVRNREDARALFVLICQIALFGVAASTEPFTTWLLFAVTPLIFQMASMRAAIPVVLLTNSIPVVVDLSNGWHSLVSDLVIAGISSAGGIWLGFWIVRVIEQNVERGRLIEELEASRAEVARLSHEAGVSAERTRLAGEIHDTLAQGFTSIITLLQAADPGLRDERLALAVRTAKENLAEARALVAALSPSALADGSLTDSVRRQAARFEEETGLAATVRVSGDERRLPTPVEVVLLRAAQEALTNVRRHAAADEATVLLAYAPESVRLTVRDDGRGFIPGQRSGYGLDGMRARVDQVNGNLTIRSEPGAGTTIELEVPA